MILLSIYIIFSLIISRLILKANIFNLASLALIAYWAAYPFEIQDWAGNIYQTIDGYKEKGIYLFAIFGFAFLLGSFIFTKANFKKIEFYKNINTENNLFFISIFLGFIGLLCFSYTHNFDIKTYLNNTLNLPRAERLDILSSAKNALPYSIFFIPSLTTLLIAIKNFGFINSFKKLFLTLIITLINSPIFLSYLIEGDRTSIIKLGVVSLFVLKLDKTSIDKKKERILLIDNFRINKKVLINRIKTTLIFIALVFSLIFIGLARGEGWRHTSRIFIEISEIFKDKYKVFPVAEFKNVNYTIDFALARDYLNIEKTEKIFTWDKLIFYPLPTYVYKAFFNEKKPPNIGTAIGIETTKIGEGYDKNSKVGFGLSPIAEGFINLGNLGVFITGLIYGISIGFLQSFYNKISLTRINFLDIIVLNTIGMVPLIMRSGSAGIYNWIFSSSFVMLLPLLIIDIYRRKNFSEIS